MKHEKNDPKIIVALDFDSIQDARVLVKQLNPTLCRLKVGKIMFTHYGPAFVEELIKQGFSVFLDLKFHDIPQTVAGACRVAAELGVWMVNVHIQGGLAMLQAAVAELQHFPEENRPYLIGVTVLTSLDTNDLQAIGMHEDVQTLVPRFAKIAKTAGLDGVVCSAQEASLLREMIAKPFLLVTPGIRFVDDVSADQKRIMTPQQAVAAGADYLVIGRSITQAKNPLAVLENIAADINKAALTRT